MSNVRWEPVVKVGDWFGPELSNVLNNRFGDRHGKMGEGVIVDKNDIVYLEGVRDAGVVEAGLLINAISLHGQIRLRRGEGK